MNPTLFHILLAEDDTNLGYLLIENLQAKGMSVTLAKTGAEAINLIAERQFDLCIFDIMLPDADGFMLADNLRKQSTTPFIFLTARALENDKLHGFEAGADDYILKPFSFKELYYRIMVVLRRQQRDTAILTEDIPIYLGSIRLQPLQRMLSVAGKEKKLSQREAGILHILLQQPGTYVNRSEILKKVWGNDDYFTAKSMDVYITRIRKLLKEDDNVEIENLYGTGYRIIHKKDTISEKV